MADKWLDQYDRKSHFVIVGAGFSGIGMAVQLLKNGYPNFVILERSSKPGGTWRDNIYPGAACDIPSYLYSFSFEPYPEWNYSFARQPEIYKYITHCIKRYDLEKKIRYDYVVEKAVFDKDVNQWELHTNREKICCNFLINCTGPLNRLKYPEIKGLETFQGKLMHTSDWDHTVDLKNRKVGVIGTGASAIQVIPAIVELPQKLTVFQRTPPWVIQRNDRKIPEWQKQLFRNFPGVQQVVRDALYWSLEWRAAGFVWTSVVMKLAKRWGKQNIRKSISDPELRKELTPTYKPGCKRILLSDNYYPALARENVELTTDSISEITQQGVRLDSGREIELDILIAATGFTAAEQMAPYPIIGIEAVDLQQLWKKGGEAYRGTMINGFPNFFMIVGPNVGLGHNSLIHMIESQVHYVIESVKYLERYNKSFLEVKPESQQSFNDWLQTKMKSTIWMQGGCNSWYLNSEGKNTTLWPGFTVGFRRLLRKFDAENFDIS